MAQLDLDRVIALFSLFSDLEGQSLARWQGFCEAAARGLTARLREDTDPESEMEALCAAAAGLAYSDYLAVQSATGSSDEVRVGDISLRCSASSRVNSDAEGLRAHFLSGIAHLLRPECPVLLATGDTA